MIEKTMLDFISLVDDKYLEEAYPAKKPKKNFGWKHITAIAASICVIVSALFVSLYIPSGNTKKPIGDGGEYPGNSVGNGGEHHGSAPQPSESCIIKTDKSEFDIDDVTLTFCFGFRFNGEIDLSQGLNVPEFDVYFADVYNEPLYLIRHSTENFMSEKYRITEILDEQDHHLIETVYNHSETVTIPAELFTKQQGALMFAVSGVDLNSQEQKYKLITGICFNYDIVNGKVKISRWDGKRM